MSRRAFTVVELIVVVVILAVLIAILLPALSHVRKAGLSPKWAANRVRRPTRKWKEYLPRRRARRR